MSTVPIVIEVCIMSTIVLTFSSTVFTFNLTPRPCSVGARKGDIEDVVGYNVHSLAIRLAIGSLDARTDVHSLRWQQDQQELRGDARLRRAAAPVGSRGEIKPT